MPRGATTRKPSKAGPHDKAKTARVATKPLKTTPARRPKAPKAAKGYNPLAPERIHEILKRLDELNAKAPPLPKDAKMDVTDSFLADKRITLLFEEGIISLEEKRAWDDRIDRFAVSLPEVQAFFEERWPWSPKKS